MLKGPNEYIYPSSGGMSEICKKIPNNNNQFEKMRILAIFGYFWPVFGLVWLQYKCLMVLMSIFFLILSEMSEFGKKFRILKISLEKMPILAIFGHSWPVFGLLWPRYKCLMVLMSIFFLVLSEMSEIGKKFLNNNNMLGKNADFGHFRPFLACFWPVLAPVSVFKGPNRYIFPSS